MSSSLPTEAPTAAFVCDCGEWALSACKGLPFYQEHEEKRYCVLHYPGKDKSAAFDVALKAKLAAKDFDFRGVWFPDAVNFSRFQFDAPVNFNSAKFIAEAYFNSAKFIAVASFRSAKFSAVAYFNSATFIAEASFRFATFSAEADFDSATFSAKASFYSATFKDFVRFVGSKERQVFGDESSLSLQSARIEKPDRFSFHTLTLRPHWFINVDARKFEFINVDWNLRKNTTQQELSQLKKKRVSSAHRLLSVACRNLAVNAEENHHYEDASRLRFMAMDARGREYWPGFAVWSLGWWYWLASGYGERVWRAFVILLGVWLLFALLYTQVGFLRWEPRLTNEQEAAQAQRDVTGAPLPFSRTLSYSLAVMALQKPEPRPATYTAHALVLLETILGPLQAALLALAIRRKFMR